MTLIHKTMRECPKFDTCSAPICPVDLHWRGAIMKNEVKDGNYDACFLSMNYLLDRWL